MKERGILMSAPMVRALLNGSKTQTRRIIAADAEVFEFLGGGPSGEAATADDIEIRWDKATDDDGRTSKPQWLAFSADYPEEGCVPLGIGYGQPGERLWVKETARCTWRSEQPPVAKGIIGGDYAAGGSFQHQYSLSEPHLKWFPNKYKNIDGAPRWQPSIFMPRWASRLTLEITGVRVERLQDISETDALAEGCVWHEPANHLSHGGWSHDERYVHTTALASYKQLWESINGIGSWDANPWVWVVEFKRVRSG